MKRKYKTILLTALIACACLAALGQEPYNGPRKFAVGDKVEATYLGEWKPAVIVGPLRTDEFGSTYEIRFEGDAHSAGRINAKWVRPRAAAPPAAPAPRAPEPDRYPDPPPARPAKPAPAPARGALSGSVLYRNGTYKWYTGAKVESYDPATRQYRIRLGTGGGDILPCHSVAKPGQADNSFFTGDWVVFVGAAMGTFTRGGDLYRRYSSGMKQPPLSIRADGTYTWRTDTGRVIQGRWSPRDGGPGITLHKSLDGLDLAVYENTEGTAPTAKTMDEIRFFHIPTDTGHYMAYRIGANRSCVLQGRSF